MLEDIVIKVSRAGRSVIIGQTPKGADWIRENMSTPSPVFVNAEFVSEIEQLMKEAGLTVLVR